MHSEPTIPKGLVMCGIVGYISKNRGENDAFLTFKLIRQSRIRGLHSFGFSWYENDEIKTKKYFQHEFKDVKIPDSDRVIFHNRYSTSGDYRDHINNQPIHIDDLSLAFNGVIDMRTKEEMEEHYQIKMLTDNDGEIVLKVSNGHPDEMVKFISDRGSFSGILLQGGKLHAFTNGNRPLYHAIIGESVFIASTQDIFIRALGDVHPEPLAINQLHTWTT